MKNNLRVAKDFTPEELAIIKQAKLVLNKLVEIDQFKDTK